MSEPDSPPRHGHAAGGILHPHAQADLDIRPVEIRAAADAGRAALTRVIGRGLQAPVHALQATLQARLLADVAGAWEAPLVLHGAYGSLTVENGARLLRALTGIDAEPAVRQTDGNWDWLQSAIAARLASTPFASCTRISGDVAGADEQAHVLELTLGSDRHLVSTRLRASWRDLTAWLEHLQWTPVAAPLWPYLGMTTRAEVTVGRHRLAAGVLRTLLPGDIVVPASSHFDPDGQGWIAFGPIRVRVRYGGPGTLTVVELAPAPPAGRMRAGTARAVSGERGTRQISQGRYMDDQQSDHESGREEEHADAPADHEHASHEASVPGAEVVDGIEIDLHFRLGHARLTLAELRMLDAGAILLLEDGSPSSVAVVAADRVLGYGELVDVEGRLGIRLTDWGSENERST